jgi:D-lactate dehydrogenase
MFFKLKAKLEYFMNRVPFLSPSFPSKFLFYISKVLPQHLPERMIEFCDKYEHHLILSMSDGGINEAKEYLKKHWSESHDSDYFACNRDEGVDILLHRFAAAGAAGNYQMVHANQVESILAFDIALRRNDEDWVEKLPKEISENIVHPLYYGHFLCNVFHRNYLLKNGANKEEIKQKILTLLDKKKAKYPAEHNVGHLYKADNNLQDFYTKLDPTNTFNPGIGRMSKYYKDCNCGL